MLTCFDTEYVQKEDCAIFTLVAPLEGWRRAETTEWPLRADRAKQIRRLMDADFPLAEKSSWLWMT
jgi:hypothetical protein